MKAIPGWLLKADDAPTGVKFEEFYPGDQAGALEARVKAHFEVYPDVKLYTIEAVEHRSE